MFKGYWRYIVAAGLVFRRNWQPFFGIGIAIGIVSLCSLHEHGQVHYQHVTGPADEQPYPPTFPLLGDPPARANSPEPCHGSQDSEEHKFCIERRSMEAAQQSAFWTKWTVIIGSIGSLLLFGSLFLSAWAAKAAADAAGHARISADAAIEQTKLALLQTRPWVKMSVDRLATIVYRTDPPNMGKAFIKITCDNVGPTPAIQFAVRSEFVNLHDREEILESLQHHSKIGGAEVLFPGNGEPRVYEVKIRDAMLLPGNRSEIGLLVVAIYKIAESDKVRCTPLYFRVSIGLSLKEETERHASLAIEPYTKHNLHPT